MDALATSDSLPGSIWTIDLHVLDTELSDLDTDRLQKKEYLEVIKDSEKLSVYCKTEANAHHHLSKFLNYAHYSLCVFILAILAVNVSIVFDIFYLGLSFTTGCSFILFFSFLVFITAIYDLSKFRHFSTYHRETHKRYEQINKDITIFRKKLSQYSEVTNQLYMAQANIIIELKNLKEQKTPSILDCARHVAFSQRFQTKFTL
jgi:hypothetical protein